MDISEEQPVVVVGAAGAGLFAAYQLAREGVPVRVFERTETFAPKRRTLIVTPELERVLGFSAGDAVVNRIHTLELCTERRTVPIRLAEPDLIVERAELLRILTTRAERAGVCIERGLAFQGLEASKSRTTLQFVERGTSAERHVNAGAVIGADGVRSQVARSLGFEPLPTVAVIQARVELPRGSEPGVGKVWFLPSTTPYFFWLCPESPNHAAVGIVDADTRAARPKLDQFLREHALTPIEYQGALVPLYQPRTAPGRRLGQTNVLLLGDAAGQVKVTTVGGTVSGLLAANAAARSLVRGTRYTRELRGVENELRLHWAIRKLMSLLREPEYDVALNLLSGKVARLLEIHNRDRLVPSVWPIMVAEPRLSLLMAQVFWRGWARA